MVSNFAFLFLLCGCCFCYIDHPILSSPLPWRIAVGNGQSTAVIPSGLGGLSTGTTAQFTPGAANSGTVSPYYVATNAAQSSTLASLLTHYSQGISVATPTTGPPTGISTGVPGGFTGTNTVSILDGSISTIPNAATTFTGPSSLTSASSQQSSAAERFRWMKGAVWNAGLGVVVGVVGGAAWIL